MGKQILGAATGVTNATTSALAGQSPITSGVITFNGSACEVWIRASVNAVVRINNFNIPFYAADTLYYELDVDTSSITVVSGTIDFIAFG